MAAAPPAPEAAPPAEAPDVVPAGLAVGARVEARWAGTWYGAVVDSTHGDLGATIFRVARRPQRFQHRGGGRRARGGGRRARAAAAAGGRRGGGGRARGGPTRLRPRPRPSSPRTTRAARRPLRAGTARRRRARVIVDMLPRESEPRRSRSTEENPKRPDSAAGATAYKAAGTCGATCWRGAVPLAQTTGAGLSARAARSWSPTTLDRDARRVELGLS